MGGFCGWNMPFSYPNLTDSESHLHVRNSAGLFDVSHMLRLTYVTKTLIVDNQSILIFN